MTHEGSNIMSMRSTVRKAARLIVVETDKEGPKFKRYRPMTPRVPRQGVRREARTAMSEAVVGRDR